MATKPDVTTPLYLVGDQGRCLAYAEACGLGGGEWWYIDTIEQLLQVPKESAIGVVCSDSEYWSMKGFWHTEPFMDAVYDLDLWFYRVQQQEA